MSTGIPSCGRYKALKPLCEDIRICTLQRSLDNFVKFQQNASSFFLSAFCVLLIPIQSAAAAWQPIERPETGSTILTGALAFETIPDELGDDAEANLGGMILATWVRDDSYFWEVMMSRVENRVSTHLGRQDTEQLHGSFNAGYLFPQRDNWRPYVSLGLGVGRFDNAADFKSDETEFNAALGGFYEISERMFVRGDLRLMGRSDVDWGPAASLGLSFQLGDIAADPPQDDDEDSIPDARDDCPNTPMGSAVNLNGCPDSDGDGVYDDADDCSNTAPGTQVDDRGCPPPEPEVDTEALLREAIEKARLTVYFEYDISDVAEHYDDDLQNLAALLVDHQNLNVTIEGHTDNMGSEVYNMVLSERRANSVKDRLVAFGVSSVRIKVVSKGESEPQATNDTEEGRAMNRRAVSVFPTID